MNTQNSKNTLNHNYPIEQGFTFPLIITALVVLIPGLVFYWLLGDAQSTPRSIKLLIGNWISPLILWFFCASFFHLWLKKAQLKKEQAATGFLAKKLIPNIFKSDTGHLMTNNDLTKELNSVYQEYKIQPKNLLSSRLSLFLNHLDDDIDETFTIKEREYMKGSFSLSRFMVWAIPIMGFIGTVWGISNGISHFSEAMTSTSSVTDVSAMLKESLPLVTSSLATAFDTTLLALLLSIPLMMLMLSLEKNEEAYLLDLDEKWFHDIKPLLHKNMAAKNQSSQAITSEENLNNTQDSSQAIANEITLLSTQIKALQETMEDLYETIFTSKLKDSDK